VRRLGTPPRSVICTGFPEPAARRRIEDCVQNGLKRTASVVAGIAGTLAALAVIGLVVVYTGAYDVAASSGHTPLTRWAFETTMHRSVQSRADEVEVPEALAARAAAGAAHYASMCQHCHGGPGIRRAGWAEGMLPRPPYLAEEAAEWDAGEVFWIVKHGIKMSGMPAMGHDHGDAEIWDIAAFVKELPAMTPQQYRAATGGKPESDGGAHAH